MMTIKLKVLFIVCCFYCSSCGTPSYDVNKPIESLAEMAEDMSPQEREQLKKSLEQIGELQLLKADRKDKSWEQKLRAELDGMTAAEIVARAQRERAIYTIMSNEQEAISILQNSILSCQIHFQSNAFIDMNANRTGEYGFIAYLAGETARIEGPGGFNYESGSIELLQGPLAEKAEAGTYQQAYGYNFKVYLPDGEGGVYNRWAYEQIDEDDGGASDREKYYVVYAWPKSKKQGRRIFAMTNDGQLFAKQGFTEPQWNDLFALKSGKAQAVFTTVDDAWQAVK